MKLRQFLPNCCQKESTVVGAHSFHPFCVVTEEVVAYKRLSDDITCAGCHCFMLLAYHTLLLIF